MEKASKKCAAFILALILTVGLIPTSLFASQADDIVSIANAEIGKTNGAKYGNGF